MMMVLINNDDDDHDQEDSCSSRLDHFLFNFYFFHCFNGLLEIMRNYWQP